MSTPRYLQVDDYEPVAKAKLDADVYDYFAGGAGDERTLEENLRAFDRWVIRPRVLRGSAFPDTSTEILGTPVASPVLVAPWAYQGRAHPDGERATVRGAARAGTIAVVSSTAVDDLEGIASASDGPKWWQLYLFAEPQRSVDMLARVVASGYQAICWTVDFPVAGLRHRDTRSGFTMPFGHDDDAEADYLYESNLTWEHLSFVRTHAPGLPVLVKGILTAEDATIAVEHGVEAIVVSNHGGRQLDSCPASLDALPEVRRGRGWAGPGPDGRRRASRDRRGQGTRVGRCRGPRRPAGRVGSRGGGRGRRGRGLGDPPRRGRERDGARGLPHGRGDRSRARRPRPLTSPVPLDGARGRPRSLSDSLQAMPGYDLHSHSNRSDGTLTPSEVMQLAREKDLAGVALTDHDTFEGLDEASAAAGELGLEFVPGIEFSAEYDGASLHILGYWVDPDDPAIDAELLRLTATRFRRGEMIVEKLRELGLDISLDRVLELAEGGAIARPHIAAAMVEAGIVADEKEAFERYISDDGLAYVPKHALHPSDALRLIGDAGGVCVLAHPGMWRGTDTVPDALIEEMAAGGMVGLEVFHPDHDEELRMKYAAVAERLDLVAISSSDCHGERYGRRMGEERTDAETFAELKRRAGR